MFEIIKYDSYAKNADFGNFPVEYKQECFSKLPIDCLTDNKVERLKVSLIKQSLDNRRYKSNPWDNNSDDLPFDGDESLISGRQL